ncbi:DUF308 domain-containing protein [Glycomyces buryatensis]|uniref:DUF4190 domain-containing protein n=1 Tax=Glycomyces buryatensis TaxID=2570927 RepID=A0A4V6T6I8_9ACTN|nr:DUF308 domain-containing protein [Glycomyces buryatensis]THV34706.1 hypothetical protein FAB82_23955 [Glycomyces buryatensis]
MAYSPNPAPTPTAQPPVKQGNGFGVTALVLGIFAILGFWLPLINISSIVLGALAIVFAIIGFAVARKREGAGNATAATGLVLGILAVGFALGWKIVIFDSAAEEAEQECLDAGASVEECASEAEELGEMEQQVEDLKDELAELVNSENGADQPADGGEPEQPADTENNPEQTEESAAPEEGAEETTE